ncbi:unnamed protein product [Lupinus luteus]|uniref:Uncharacterized protein n=1 Tax=Lupinus luteus TaxID=3873 RepID=A0AAV1WTM3_LUPLU
MREEQSWMHKQLLMQALVDILQVTVAMTPHIYGTTIDAQLCYAAGIKDMLERHFKGEDFPEQHYIVKEGQLASQYR